LTDLGVLWFMIGELKANIDVKVVYWGGPDTPLTTIVRVPIYPINIPGVLSIVPEFRINTGVNFESIAEVLWLNKVCDNHWWKLYTAFGFSGGVSARSG
jgi:hypothetical protein